MATIFQVAANRVNAQLSTGPRTEEGKNQSRCNSYKHGFKALLIPGIENSTEVEASRDRWLACFPGGDEVTQTMADMAFRAKRRLVNVADADDAAIVLRVEKVAEVHYLGLRATIDDGWKAFCEDPNVGVEALIQSEMGCQHVLVKLELMLKRCQQKAWSLEDGRNLLGFEKRGSAAGQAQMVEFTNLFDETSIREQRGLEVTADESTNAVLRIQAIARIEALQERRKEAQADLEGRIKAVLVPFQKRAALIAGSDVRKLHVLRDDAKFDSSEEGRLRRRYLAEAQRDLLKAVEAARKISAQVVAQKAAEQAEKGKAAAKAARSSTTGSSSPNEAKSGWDDDDDFDDEDGSDVRPSGSKRGRRRSS